MTLFPFQKNVIIAEQVHPQAFDATTKILAAVEHLGNIGAYSEAPSYLLELEKHLSHDK